jgi:hypothetical protein
VDYRGGIFLNDKGILNGTAVNDGIFMANINVSSHAANASANLNVEVDVPKQKEVKIQNIDVVDIVNYRGNEFSIATDYPNDRYDIIAGVLPQGVTLNNDTGVFSGIPQEAGSFNLTVRVSYNDTSINDGTIRITNDFDIYSYADIQVNLYVETAEEALAIDIDNFTNAVENNVNQYQAFVDSLNKTLNEVKGVYSNSVEIVNDINTIIDNAKGTFNTLTNLFNNVSKMFTLD